MWSGPRTISTALMRAWEHRPDTVVVDEPLYGFYLARTGLPHPGRDEVIKTMNNGWRDVLDELTLAPFPAGKTVFYAKHMTHHLLPEVDRGALAPLRHAYLIRDPRQLLASYAKVRAQPTLEDLGLPQQVEIFRTFGGPVVDSGDILRQPEPALRALCAALGVPFARRAQRTAEYVEAIRTLWSDDRASFSGEFVRFDAVRVYPKPVRDRRIPVVVGGNSDAALRRVAAFGDGWYGFNLTADAAAQRIGVLDRYCRERGRALGDLIVAVALTDGSPAILPDLARIGVTELVLAGAPPAAESAAADWVAELAAQWIRSAPAGRASRQR